MDKLKVSFSWDLHWACNYRCPYCWWHGKWEEYGRRNIYPGTKKVLEIWEDIYKKYGQVHIEIAGGEPSTYPDFAGVISGLLDYHTLGIITNLSSGANELLEKCSDDKLKRLKLGATFHPLFADIEMFLKNVKILKAKGVSVGVLYLAYPEQVHDIPRYKEIFDRNGIHFSVLTFWGEYKNKKYPESYTDEELSIIYPELEKRAGEKFQTKPFITKGKLCNAGFTYAIIHPDGEILRCGGGSWKGENIKLGNLFGKIELWNEPKPCHSQYCPCNEWAFLLVEK